MTPVQLNAACFAKYANQARQMATASLPLLQKLPLGFLPFLLKEIISADVKFPAELKELTEQLQYLSGLPPEKRVKEMQPFAELKLNPNLESFDWVNSPAQFLEQLSAHLWATHQMDGFRGASENYVQKFRATLTPTPLPVHRVGVVVIGSGVQQNTSYPLFVKLRREGTLFTQVNGEHGLPILHSALEERAQNYAAPYSHWCLDGATAPALKGFSSVGYEQMAAVRSALTSRMLTAYQAKPFDPEKLRTTLAQSTFESLGIKPTGDPPLDNFSLSLLTEGSGTQIYSTTFVQWAAREALRRAQPLTIFARYAPRQRERSMAELLSSATSSSAALGDPMGSLVDADMGSYYTWLNQQRLHGAETSRFLVWFENHKDAVVIAPTEKRGTVNSSSVDLVTLVKQVLSS